MENIKKPNLDGLAFQIVGSSIEVMTLKALKLSPTCCHLNADF
jgi:hypothetical protein